MAIYFGFALASGMFNGNASIQRQVLEMDAETKTAIEQAVNCCNASHSATVEAAEKRFGLSLVIPEKPPSINLNSGDSLIVMGVRGLPRLEDRRHYTAEEIEAASFEFVKYSVV